MTKSLTEQWKDGTIKEGLYFIKTKHEKCYKEETDMLFPDGCRAAFSIYPIVEVLAPVPSYDEYQRLVSNSDESFGKTEQLEKQLAIATKALKEYANCKPTEWMSCVTADKALKEIEEVK